MDDPGIRTMFAGLIVGTVLYTLGMAARAWLPEPLNLTVWTILTILGMVFLVGWFVAVKRGFRLPWLERRKGKRAKGRKARSRFMPPPRPRR